MTVNKICRAKKRTAGWRFFHLKSIHDEFDLDAGTDVYVAAFNWGRVGSCFIEHHLPELTAFNAGPVFLNAQHIDDVFAGSTGQ